MPEINNNAALPRLPLKGKSAINVDAWMSDIKVNFTSLIRSMFAQSEQGFAYDPNDLSTMYQDSAGVLPVTGWGQPVGLILDKSKGGKLGNELFTQFNADLYSTLSQNIPPTMITSTTAIGAFGAGVVDLIKGKPYRIELSWSGNIERAGISLETANLSVFLGNAESGSVSRIVFPTAWGSFFIKKSNPTVGQTFTIHTVSIKEVLGNHAYQTMAARRPLLQRSAKTGAYYLEFDGIDDCLQTNNIDFTISDQMSLFVGICKIKDSRPAVIVALSADMYQQNGTFGLWSPFSNGGTNSFSAKGSVANTVKFYDTVPVTPYFTVLAAKMCISTDLMQLRNSGIVDKSSADLGVGNIGNHPLFIGNMGNSSYSFGGQVYSLIGVSRLATDNETLALEKVIAKQVGVTLNV